VVPRHRLSWSMASHENEAWVRLLVPQVPCPRSSHPVESLVSDDFDEQSITAVRA
jgi:hypothetical protein